MKPQTYNVLLILRSGPTCGTTFLRRHFLPRFGARILELKQAGYSVEKRVCVNPEHGHGTRQWEYLLTASPARSIDKGSPYHRETVPS